MHRFSPVNSRKSSHKIDCNSINFIELRGSRFTWSNKPFKQSINALFVCLALLRGKNIVGCSPSLSEESEAFESTKINKNKQTFPPFIEITPDSSDKFISRVPFPVRGITRALLQGMSAAQQSQPAPMKSHNATEGKIPALILSQIWGENRIPLFNNKYVSWLITPPNLSWRAGDSHGGFVGDSESRHTRWFRIVPLPCVFASSAAPLAARHGSQAFFDIFRYPWTSLDGSKKLHLATWWASAHPSAPSFPSPAGSGSFWGLGTHFAGEYLIPFTQDTSPSGCSLLPITVQHLYKPTSILKTQ